MTGYTLDFDVPKHGSHQINSLPKLLWKWMFYRRDAETQRKEKSAIYDTIDDLVVLIFAVDASMPFYQGFGFSRIGNWTVDQDRQFPAGALRVSRQTLSYIRQTLQKRGIKVEGNLVLEASESNPFEVQEGPDGLINIKFLKQEGAGRSTEQQNP